MRLLAEKKYALKDPENKYGLDLEESLNKARKGKVFAGKTFYLAGKSLSGSMGLLKNVVQACGGQVCVIKVLLPA